MSASGARTEYYMRFVQLWNDSANRDDAFESINAQLGGSYRHVVSTAHRLRREHDIPLTNLPMGPERDRAIDWECIAKVARACLKSES